MSGFLFTGGKKTLHTCSYCKRDITQQFRSHCVNCSTEESPYELCADCFSVGTNAAPHSNTHKYRIVDCIDIPIFKNDWTAAEELLLLEGIEKHGMGNWKIVSEYIGGSKNTNQVESHYWETYMGRHGYCLPQTTIINDTVLATETIIGKAEVGIDDESHPMRTALLSGHELGELVIRDKGKEVGNIGVLPVVKEKSSSKDKSNETQIRDKIAQLPGADLPGFMPLREDFDYEHENDAEALLADMDFDDDDHPSERELKLQVIRIYNKKLDERDERKRFVIDRGFVDFKQQQQAEKKRTKEERELVARLQIFLRFQSAREHEALVNGLVLARKLRNQVELYQQYRKLGIRSLDEAVEYEIEKKKREEEAKQEKHRKEAGYLYDGRGNGNAGRSSKSGSRRGKDSEDEGAPSKKSKVELAELDLSTAPGYALLSDTEVGLCNSVHMLPMHYLACKEAIIR